MLDECPFLHEKVVVLYNFYEKKIISKISTGKMRVSPCYENGSFDNSNNNKTICVSTLSFIDRNRNPITSYNMYDAGI